ncbi:hypothetical protein LTR15_005668 [Elasticomyces elasticus]|nr:hypothetical protein LTR15_005668 [Elasticomyces elasticus]
MPPLLGSDFNPLIRVSSGSHKPRQATTHHTAPAPTVDPDSSSSEYDSDTDTAASPESEDDESEDDIRTRDDANTSEVTNTATPPVQRHQGLHPDDNRTAAVPSASPPTRNTAARDVVPPSSSTQPLASPSITASSTPNAAEVDSLPKTLEEIALQYRHGLQANDQRLAGLGKGLRVFNKGQDCCTFSSPFVSRMQVTLFEPKLPQGTLGCGGTLKLYGSKKANASINRGEYPDVLVPFSLIASIILFKTFRSGALFSFEMIVVPVGAVGTSSASESSPRCIKFKRSNEHVKARHHHPEKLEPYLDALIKACDDRLSPFGRKVTEARLEDSVEAEWDARQFGHVTGVDWHYDEGVVAFFVPDVVLISCNSSRRDLYIPFCNGIHGASRITLVANVELNKKHHDFEVWIEGITESSFWADDRSQKRARTASARTQHRAEESDDPQAAPTTRKVVLKVNSFDEFDRVCSVIQKWHRALKPAGTIASATANVEEKENRVLLGQKRKHDSSSAGNVIQRQGVKIRRAQIVWSGGKPVTGLEKYAKYEG